MRTSYVLPVLFVLLALGAQPALAATITVDANCSLNNAIRSANGVSQIAPMNGCETGDAGAYDYNIGSVQLRHKLASFSPTSGRYC